MTCASCISSRRINGVLMCNLVDIPAIKVCRFFVYEPGTDEPLHHSHTERQQPHLEP